MEGLVKKSSLYLQKHSSTILTVLGSAGVVATTILAVRATPKALRLLEKATDEKGEELSRTEIVQVAGPVYIPTIVLGTTTIACIFGANIFNKRSQASIVSAYAFLNESYAKYRRAANEVYGEEADDVILTQAAEEVYVSGGGIMGDVRVYTPSQDNSEEVLFYDFIGQRYFTSTMANVLNAQYHANRNLILRGSLYLNEFYDFIGIDHVENGDDLGWDIEVLTDWIWLDFKNQFAKMEDGMECFIMSTMVGPELID